jgi:hypothetical protein
LITIRKSPTADSRTCDVTKVTKHQLIESSSQHIVDVGKGLQYFKGLLTVAGLNHDADKITDIDGFYSNFQNSFSEGHTDWWDRHKELNRHHLSPVDGKIPEDVNLIDVLDYIADCTMAGMARSGEVRTIVISQEVLMRAFWNTAKLLENQVKVED